MVRVGVLCQAHRPDLESFVCLIRARIFSGNSATAEKAEMSQQLPSPPCQMHEGARTTQSGPGSWSVQLEKQMGFCFEPT